MELYSLDNHCDLKSIHQVQAVCFLNDKEIVLYENIEGWFGNPGGTIEVGEDIEEALRRELIEEAQLKVIAWKIIGVEKVFYPNKLKAEKESCFLRVVAKVELIDKEIIDPDGKAIGRIIVGVDEAVEKLACGEKGESLIKLAQEKYNQIWG